MSRPARGIITRRVRVLSTPHWDARNRPSTYWVRFDLDHAVPKEIALAHLELVDNALIVVLPPKHVGNKRLASKKRIEHARIATAPHGLIKGAPNRVFYIGVEVEDPVLRAAAAAVFDAPKFLGDFGTYP